MCMKALYNIEYNLIIRYSWYGKWRLSLINIVKYQIYLGMQLEVQIFDRWQLILLYFGITNTVHSYSNAIRLVSNDWGDLYNGSFLRDYYAW